jgi:hypothetical protein
MKRLVLAGLVVVVLGVVAGSALASNAGNGSVIYDSAPPGGLPGNLPSLGPEAYAFRSLGDKITFAPGSRRLSNVVVTLSSWACQQGTWYDKNCVSAAGAKFAQPITLTIWDANHTTQLVSSTQTFQVPYRPSASPKCVDGGTPTGKWYQPGTGACFNGLATQVTFNFAGNVTLPGTVVYEISYDTSNYGPSPLRAAGPYDSLNIGISPAPSVGSTADEYAWTNGAMNPGFEGTPAVQFNASRLWRVT